MATIVETKRLTSAIGDEQRHLLVVHLVPRSNEFDTLAKRARVSFDSIFDRNDGEPGRSKSFTYRVASSANGGPPGWTAADATAFRNLIVSAFDVD